MQPTVSQNATLNTLSASVDNALVYPAGSPLLIGSNCNASSPTYCVSVDGHESASWTSGAQGVVTFSNYGWHDHLPATGVGAPTSGGSTLVSGTPQFIYRFVSDITGTMDIHYTVSYTGPDCFGVLPFDVNVSGGHTGTAAAAGLDSTCGTISGDILAPIDGGFPYLFELHNQSNLNGGLLDRTAVLDATFSFSIPSSTATTPEPASLGLLGTGLLALAAYIKKRML